MFKLICVHVFCILCVAVDCAAVMAPFLGGDH